MNQGGAATLIKLAVLLKSPQGLDRGEEDGFKEERFLGGVYWDGGNRDGGCVHCPGHRGGGEA